MPRARSPVLTLILTASLAGACQDGLLDVFRGTGAPPGPATHLFIEDQPLTVKADSAFVIDVTARDAENVHVSAPGAVTVAIAVNPASGALSGTTSLPGNAVLSFTNLRIDKPGTGYTVTATSPGLQPATTVPFNVVP